MIQRTIPRLVAVALSLCVAACSNSRPPYSFTEATMAETRVAGARDWADVPASQSVAANVVRRSRQAGKGPPTYLSLSGGAGDGAYGAGILTGWTESGLRPEFDVVSGVSTGALIAPFAFLGPRYDGILRELYTSGIAASVVSSPSFLRAVTGSSFMSNDKLRELVAKYVTPAMLAEIARASDQGRLLEVITTNLDAQRPVKWNMSRIAKAGTPEALDLFRQVLVASASVPVIFPPILIDVQARGRAFNEMHVDGSLLGNTFIFPQTNLLSGSLPASARGAHVYVLLNSSPLPQFAVAQDSTFDIASKTVSLGIKSKTYDEINLAFSTARRTGIDLAVTFNDRRSEGGVGLDLDPKRMSELFDYGERLGRTGRFWRRSAPNLTEIARLEAQ